MLFLNEELLLQPLTSTFDENRNMLLQKVV